MKRFLVCSASLLLSVLFVGCNTDTHDGLVSDTIHMIGIAGTEVGNIKSRVTEATEKAKAGKKLDLADAIEATKKLKDTGDEAQKLKRKIEQVRAQISDEDKKGNATKHKAKLTAAFQELLTQKEQLRTALAEAEKISPSAKTAVKDLRDKIVEAESPFEALSR
jgi:predicted  nucleic acid-binding Zn-ribbon protein